MQKKTEIALALRLATCNDAESTADVDKYTSWCH